MRFRTLAIASLLSAGFAPQKGLDKPVVTANTAPRAHRDVAWKQNALPGLPGWQAQWDRDTDVPLRAWGPSISAPNTIADASAAEAFARAFLAQHLAELAPGALADDFVLAANTVDTSGMRTVSYVQRYQGLPVVGGSIALLFSHDRLIMTSSTALPHIYARLPGATLPSQQLEESAARWLANAGYKVTTTGHGDRVLLPIVRPRGNAAQPEIEYRVVETVTVEAERGAGRWDVWLDSFDAAPVARHTKLMFASGIVNYNVPDRSPSYGARTPRPAPFTRQQVNGMPQTSPIDGTVTWTQSGDATIGPGLTGTYAQIINKAGGLASATLTLANGGTALWDLSSNDQSDAQLDAFIYENTAKQFVLTTVNPNLDWAKKSEQVNVNENMTCNAFSTGDDIHFFQKDTMCENTGRISDVVYHETGHSVHYNSIIPGAGAFDSSLSEGLADTLAIAITGDHGLGRGFFFSDAPLRDVAPATPKVWPQDADGEPHDEGEIIGESLWDTRVALQNKLGQAAGYAQFIKIYYGIVQRSPDIPSSYAEAIAADDDDGNLANGTPNICEINAAFGRHGLADPSATIGLQPPTRDNFTIAIAITPPATTCPNAATVTSATVDWNPRGAAGGTFDLAQAGTGWSAAIPTQPDGTVVEYKVTVKLSDGSQIVYPQNAADPKYQFYVGTVTPIQCWDFEGGLSGWTHSATPTPNDAWGVGTPMGIGGGPKTAHGGSMVLGMDLGTDGTYQSNTKQNATSPMVDLGGATTVHLQYWRWLGVEDGAYDQATISANGMQLWANLASPGMPTTEVNHVDKEWRFQDVDVTPAIMNGQMQLKFELDSDPGLQLSGWAIDDVCLVRIGPAPQCMEGDPSCNPTDPGKKTGGGCCSTSGGAGGSALLGLGTLAMVLRRRYRNR
jgi:hypothetical protein